MQNDISDEEIKIYLNDNTRAFPKRVIAKKYLQTDYPTMIYVPRRTCHILISFDDEDRVIGSSKCSECNTAIDIFSKYCPNCGAKCIGKKVEGEVNDKD